MSYITFAWLATFIFGFETVIIKLTSKYSIKNPWLFNFLWNIFFVVFMIPVYLSHPIEWPKVWPSLLIASVFSAVTSVLFMISTYKLDVSVISPLYNVKTGLTVFFAWIILGEKMTQFQIAMICIIILMGFLVTIDEKTTFKSFFRKDIIVAMIFMVILALYVVYLRMAMNDLGMWNATVWVAVFTLIFLIPTYPKFAKDLKKITKKQIIPVIFVAATSSAAYVISNKAYEINVGITSVIMTFPSSMVLAFIMAVIWPKLMERHSMKIYALRFAATAVMFVCAIQLG